MQSRRRINQLVKVFVLAIVTVFTTGSVFAQRAIEVIYTAGSHSQTLSFNSGENIAISRPWTDVEEYFVQIRASSAALRQGVDVGVITVSDASGITCHLNLQFNSNSNTLSSYAFRNCAGIELASNNNSNLTIEGRIYGDLTGDITEINGWQDIVSIDFRCVGSIK